MRVGITVLPARSTTRAPGPARALISADVPTATIRPPPIATACATVLRPSTVMTAPSINAKSTRDCAVATFAAATLAMIVPTSVAAGIELIVAPSEAAWRIVRAMPFRRDLHELRQEQPDREDRSCGKSGALAR